MKRILLLIAFISITLLNAQTPISATIAYQGYDETQAYLGQGEYQIFLDNTDGVFDKPIIVVDGFDPGDTRDIAGMYASLNYDGTNIADQLRSEGFDFVFLNFPTYVRASDNLEVDGGADYIQRNAMILTELIQQINNDKVGSEQLVVVGPSMGGLISRYALRYMEQNSLDHQTRLYISWDTPHRGANIPMNLQYLLNYFAEVNGGNADLQATIASLLGSPASKEMLTDIFYAHLDDGSTYEQNPAILLPIGATNFRDAFQTEIDAMGFPQQTRNIAIANGSGIGAMSGTPGMEILNHTFDVPDVDNVTVDIVLHYTPPSNQTIEITNAITKYSGLTIATYVASAQSFSYTDGIDSAPGGKYDIQSFLGAAQGNDFLTELIANLQQSEFCFIPTLSAMAIDNEDNWFASIDIPATHNTPFDAYYIPDVNEDHVTPTTANMAFVLPEIRNGVSGVTNTNFDSVFKLKSNPVSNEIVVYTSNKYDFAEVSITSISGQKLMSKKIINIENEISFPINLSNGIYFLKVQTEGKLYLKKILVSK